MAETTQVTAAVVGEQLFATHCRRSDSVTNAEGFAVRATSTDAPELVRFAGAFPGYELPLEMRGQDLAPQHAPVRLARVRLADGRVAVIHTVLVQRDAFGRPGSYFTHFVVCNQCGPQCAAQAWNARGWRTEYDGPTNRIDPFAGDLQGNSVDDHALRRFVDGAPPDNIGSHTSSPAEVSGSNNQGLAEEVDDHDGNRLSVMVHPSRLAGDTEQRRRLVCQALGGFLLVLQASPQRARLFVRAEPGLVALLAYAVARFLPRAFTDALSFSTYEAPHRLAAAFPYCQIIGTYNGQTGRPLDEDCFQRIGFGLDTIASRASPEVEQEAVLLQQLVRVGTTDWDCLDRYRALQERDRSLTPETYRTALQLLPTYWRLSRGDPTEVGANDLTRLTESALGRILLDEFPDLVLRRMVSLWPAPSAPPAALKSWRADRLAKLEATAINRLARDEAEGCLENWVLLCAASPHDAEARICRIMEAAIRSRGVDASLALRCKLFQACTYLYTTAKPLPPKVFGLIGIPAVTELPYVNQISSEWAAQGLGRLIDRHGAEILCIAINQKGLEPVLRQFCSDASADDGEARQLLARRLPAFKNACEVYQQLEGFGLSLQGAALDGLLFEVWQSSGTDARAQWLEYWLQENRLVDLTERLPVPKKGGRYYTALWEAYARDISIRDLVDVQCTRAATLNKLRVKVKDRPPPPDAQNALRDWWDLRELLENPSKSKVKPEILTEACKRLKIDNIQELLVQYYAPRWDGAPAMVQDAIRAARQLHRAKTRAPRMKFLFDAEAASERAMLRTLIGIVDAARGDKKAIHRTFLWAISQKNRLRLAREFWGELDMSEETQRELFAHEANLRKQRRHIGIGVAAGFVLGVTITLSCNYLLSALRRPALGPNEPAAPVKKQTQIIEWPLSGGKPC